jgi:DNA helicase II / ATP-dependent DNA helicase PcrA
MSAPPPGRPAGIRSEQDLCRILGVPYTREQLDAIKAPLEPGVIVAGAGSGKTAVMAARVVWLVGTGQVAPGEVLGLTFTNKAAAELRERVNAGLRAAGLHPDADDGPDFPAAPGGGASGLVDGEDEEIGEPIVSTYHAYADRLIKEHGLRLGLEPSARLLADANRFTLAARVVRTAAGPFDQLSGSIANITKDLIALDSELSEHVVRPARLRDFDAEFTRIAETRRDPVTGRSVKERSRTTNRLGMIYTDYLDAAAVSGARMELLGLVETYRALKAERDFVDFGDQMAWATRLAEEAPEVGRIERERFRVVLLDEYQDTSVAQRRMLVGLFSASAADGAEARDDDAAPGRAHAVTAVGDPCQSIYGWRGASAANIDLFPEHFPRARGNADVPGGPGAPGGPAVHLPARRYTLTENRRSGGRLLAFANERSADLREHHGVEQLAPCAEKAGLGYCVAGLLPTYDGEVAWIGEQVQGLAGHVPWSQVAILVRKGAQIPRLYGELHERGIPVEVVGLSGLLDLPEIADLVAMLDVLDDPIANSSLVRLLTGPRWRIGPRDLALLGRRARDLVHPPDGAPSASLDRIAAQSDPTDVVSLSDALADPGEDTGFSDAARTRFARLAAEIRRLRRSLSEPVLDVLHRILQETGLDVEIAASPAAYRARCADTIGAFLAVAGRFADLDGDQSATAFRAFLKAGAEHERGLDIDLPPTEADTVKILTMHKAKGLEWECVLVPHQYPDKPRPEKWTGRRGKLPHELRGDPMPILDDARDKTSFAAFDEAMAGHAALEDARLDYVTLTRAKSRLIMSSHWWGPTQAKPRGPSDLLAALAAYCRAGGLDPHAACGEVAVWAPRPGEERNPALDRDGAVVWPPDLRDDQAVARRRAAAEAVTRLARELGARAQEEAGAGAETGALGRTGSDSAPPTATVVTTSLRRLPAAPAASIPEQAEHVADPAARRLVEGWDRDLEALLDELRRAREVRFEVPMPHALSATRLMSYARDPDGFAEELFRPMPRPPAPQARRGTEFHAWVERRFGQLTLFDEDDLDVFADEEIDGAEDLAALKDAFLRSEYARREPYRVEAPFQLLLGGGIVRGRIDAVYQDPDGSFEVVDWKTGRSGGSDPFQLAVYRLAWSEIAQVPIEQVRAAFLYVRSGAVERHADLPDRAAIEARLAGFAPPQRLP